MRQAIALVFAVGLFAVMGCKPPPKDQAIGMFKQDVQRHFNDLNRDAMDRKARLRGDLERVQNNPNMDAPTGTVYNTFVFEPDGFVVADYKCKACGITLLLAAPASQYLCPSCGHSPYQGHAGVNLKVSPCEKCAGQDGRIKAPTDQQIAKEEMKLAEGATVKEMFELTQDNPEKPLIAKVRYVRKLWVFDPRGSVKLSQAAQTKGAVDMTWMPSDAPWDPTNTDPMARYSRPGFHRLDGTYVGEITFEWKGGSLREVSRQAEVAVRPWKDLTTVGK